MEDNLQLQWKCRAKSFTIDGDENDVSLVSHKITKHTREMAQVSGSEFPTAAIALKCITKEAELMCQCIITGDRVVSFAISNAVRRRALILMTCTDYVPATAAMMGIMKEAESLIGLLKGDQVKNNARMMCTDHLRHRTLFIMSELCDECSDVVEPTVGDITGDLNSNESDNKLADNGNHGERGNVTENKDSTKELARNDMDESNKTDENQNPNEKLGRNSLEKGEVKPETKASTEKQVDLVGSSNEGDSSTSEENKLKDVLKEQSSPLPVCEEQSSPLYGKAGGHKKWFSGCFNFAKR
ncbi:hypothetical protein BDA96_09G229000 [Sorghum bicolor]|nr:hypothetical protein BDA96_09G229000 [Sorghum bicolor]